MPLLIINYPVLFGITFLNIIITSTVYNKTVTFKLEDD